MSYPYVDTNKYWYTQEERLYRHLPTYTQLCGLPVMLVSPQINPKKHKDINVQCLCDKENTITVAEAIQAYQTLSQAVGYNNDRTSQYYLDSNFTPPCCKNTYPDKITTLERTTKTLNVSEIKQRYLQDYTPQSLNKIDSAWGTATVERVKDSGLQQHRDTQPQPQPQAESTATHIHTQQHSDTHTHIQQEDTTHVYSVEDTHTYTTVDSSVVDTHTLTHNDVVYDTQDIDTYIHTMLDTTTLY